MASFLSGVHKFATHAIVVYIVEANRTGEGEEAERPSEIFLEFFINIAGS